MRKRTYEIIEVSTGGDLCSSIYDAFMMVAIVALPAGIITAGYMSEIEKEKTPSEDSDGNA